MKEQHRSDRQIKFADADHGQLRERLRELEAECQGSPILEDNWIFDRDGAMETAGSNLRLRVDRRGARLSFQGPASFDGPVKICSEHETGVDEIDETRAILESLGYHVIRRYQKYREQWQLGSIAISLDHTPIGDFVELEGDGCERVARRCGLDPEQAEGRNYLQLYACYLEAHPDAPADMVFP